MLDLTDSDYDALYAVFEQAMPRVNRALFPEILAQLVADGVLSIWLTETEIIVGSLEAPEVGLHRVARTGRMH